MVFQRCCMCMHTQEKSECLRSPHTSLSPDESAAVQIHLEFNSTRKHFCHIFIRKLRFSRYTAEKGKCIPAYLTRMQRLLIEQTRRGVQGGGRKGGGRGEKGGREKKERGGGEGRKGEGRTGGREKGWRRREKGTPLYPSQQVCHKELPYVILRGKDLRSTTSYVNMTSSVQE